jgi:flagellar hook-associated protein 1
VSGLLQLLGVGAQSLAAQQLAEATAGNNAANSATPGYSRRRVTLIEAPSAEPGTGGGVTATGLQRLRDALADHQFRADSRDMQFAQAQAGVLSSVSALLSPAGDTPLGNAMNGLFAAFGDLAARPEDASVRQVVVTQAQAFVDAAHGARDSIEGLARDVTQKIMDRVTEAGDAARNLAALNTSAGTQGEDPTLADKRDQLVDRLSELLGVRVVGDTNGTVTAVIDGTGIQLVSGTRAATIAARSLPDGTVRLTVDGNEVKAPGGEIGGLIHVRNSNVDGLPAAQKGLDDLAGGVIAAVNRVHATGVGLAPAKSFTASVAVADSSAPLAADGLPVAPISGALTVSVFDATGQVVTTSSVNVDPATMSVDALATALSAIPGVSASVSAGKLTVSTTDATKGLAFAADASDVLVGLGLGGFFSGRDAGSIAVAPEIVADPSRIASGRASGGAVKVGDTGAASALAALGQQTILAGGTLTPAGFLGSLGAKIGAAERSATGRGDALTTALQSDDARRQATSGVSTDEELADMVRFQHAYEASAKFVSTIDQMIQAVLGMVS